MVIWLSETCDLDNFLSVSNPIWRFWTLLMKWITVCDVWIATIFVIKSAGMALNSKKSSRHEIYDFNFCIGSFRTMVCFSMKKGLTDMEGIFKHIRHMWKMRYYFKISWCYSFAIFETAMRSLVSQVMSSIYLFEIWFSTDRFQTLLFENFVRIRKNMHGKSSQYARQKASVTSS